MAGTSLAVFGWSSGSDRVAARQLVRSVVASRRRRVRPGRRTPRNIAYTVKANVVKQPVRALPVRIISLLAAWSWNRRHP